MLISVKTNRPRVSFTVVNTTDSIDRCLTGMQVRNRDRTPRLATRIWWVLPEDSAQLEALKKLLTKSKRFITFAGVGEPALNIHGQHYGSVAGMSMSLDATVPVEVFENLLRKIAHILTWVELYGRDARLSDTAFKRETFERVVHQIKPITDRVPNPLMFPAVTAAPREVAAEAERYSDSPPPPQERARIRVLREQALLERERERIAAADAALAAAEAAEITRERERIAAERAAAEAAEITTVVQLRRERRLTAEAARREREAVLRASRERGELERVLVERAAVARLESLAAMDAEVAEVAAAEARFRAEVSDHYDERASDGRDDAECPHAITTVLRIPPTPPTPVVFDTAVEVLSGEEE